MMFPELQDGSQPTVPALSAGAAAHRPFLHPRFRQLPPPVIVIGMHRSGTSVVAAMLACLGVYMGPVAAADVPAPEGRSSVPGYSEAEEFRQLNELALTRAGAAWNQIGPFLERRDNRHFARRMTAVFQFASWNSLRREYLRGLPSGVVAPWGWKDPRNSLTLPLWLRLFPEARILHVRRNQEDVVDSLHRRAQDWQAAPGPPLPAGSRLRQWVRHPGTTLRRAGRRFGLLPAAGSDPCLDRDYCRFLCQRYVEECLRYRDWGDRYFEVSYEELLTSSTVVASRTAAFLGCPASPEHLLQAASLVRRERSARVASPFDAPRDTRLAVGSVSR